MTDATHMTFPEKLNALCLQLGISQRELAQTLNIDHTTISRWLHNGARPRNAVAKRLADFFQVDVAKLLDDSVSLSVPGYGSSVNSTGSTAQRLAARSSAASVAELSAASNTLRDQANELRRIAQKLEEQADKIYPRD
jgi:transcriptional regulator with XRE-family HTH domain